MNRIALVMAGGTGERFWPLSRPDRPKQLLALTTSGRVMLDETVVRIEPVFQLENVYVVTSKQLLEPIQTMLPWLAGQVLDEPSRKNSAGGIVWGMGVVAGLAGTADLSFAVVPSDHKIHPAGLFREDIGRALRIAEASDRLVTIGIPPTRAETGYGYIECGPEIEPGAFEIAGFVEKPELALAGELISKPSTLWNSGMFFWRYGVFLDELRRHSPLHAEALEQITFCVSRGDADGARRAFEALPFISIDHALMEKSRASAVVRATFEWDDLGAWDSLSRVLPLDEGGNAVAGMAECYESSGCVVVNGGSTQVVQVLGATDLVVVATDDAVLVCPKDRAQDVRRLVRE